MDDLKAIRSSIDAQLTEINAELAKLISQSRFAAHSARAGSLGAQRAKLLRALRELDAAERRFEAEELQRRTGSDQ